MPMFSKLIATVCNTGFQLKCLDFKKSKDIKVFTIYSSPTEDITTQTVYRLSSTIQDKSTEMCKTHAVPP